MLLQRKLNKLLLEIMRRFFFKRFLWVIILVGLSASVNASCPYFFKILIDNLTNNKLNSSLVLYFSILYSLILILGKIIDDLKLSILSRLDAELSGFITIDFLKSIVYQEFDGNSNKHTGKLIHALGLINRSIKDIAYNLFIQLLPIIFEITIVFFIIFFNFNNKYSLCFLSMVFICLIMNVLLTRWSLKARIINLKSSFSLFDSLSRVIFGRQFIALHNAQMFSSDYCDIRVKDFQKTTVLYINKVVISGILYSIIQFAFFVYIFFNSLHDAYSFALSIGSFILISYYASYFIKPMQSFANIYVTVCKSLVDIYEILTEYTGIIEKPLKINSVEFNKQLQSPLFLHNKSPSIFIKNIFFKGISEHFILSDINLTIPSETNVAFVGASGSGKSTLAHILVKQLEPESGNIYFGDQNIVNLDTHYLRNKIHLTPQNPSLIFDTLIDNLQMPNPKATWDEIKEALDLACFSGLLNSEMWGEKIFEKDTILSGGELQRLHIAQAFLRNAMIYIWDETTSHLDGNTRDKILSNIFLKSKGKTNIFITHDASVAGVFNELCQKPNLA
jgi:ABC-type multidrug transport system fused ATPase/permease subunit